MDPVLRSADACSLHGRKYEEAAVVADVSTVKSGAEGAEVSHNRTVEGNHIDDELKSAMSSKKNTEDARNEERSLVH